MSSDSQPLLPHDNGDYLRQECDHLLMTAHRSDSQENLPLDVEGLLGNSSAAGNDIPTTPSESALRSQQRKASLVRILALLCACSLSVGSH